MRRVSSVRSLRRQPGLRIAAAAVLLAGTGLALPGAAAATGPQAVSATREYACQLPGWQPASAQVAVSIPAAGTAGQPVKPTAAGITVTLPRADAERLASLKASTVTVSALLSMEAAEGGTSASDPWSVTPASAPVPSGGDLVLRLPAAVPPVTERAAGNVTFTAAGLSVLLVPHAAAGSTTPGPAPMHLDCALSAGQPAALATVPVAAAPAAAGPARPATSGCPPFPKNGFPFNPHFKLPPFPPGSTVTFPPDAPQGCAFIEGFSDVRKLGEAALVGPGLSNLESGKRVVLNQKVNYIQLDSAGKLYFKPCPGSAPQCRPVNGLPPVHATFLSFGFVPTTATLLITQTGTLDVASVGEALGPLKFSKVMSLASIRIQSVQVNGVSLNVGSDCRTVRPFRLTLIGKPPYSLQFGGVLNGNITVPPFTGCGVGENLDPIFTSSVSGPGNFIQLTQGTLCTPDSGFGCPPTVPKPVH